MPERIILVGFMCSGKSTVGRGLAERLGWEFIDFDEWIEREEGRRITEIFREEGEPYFRRLEARLTERLKERRRVVLAPGGGWIMQREPVAILRAGSRMVWLQVTATAALERAGADPTATRPLLSGDDPLEVARSLLEEREPFYQQADLCVDTVGRTPEEVVETVAAWLER